MNREFLMLLHKAPPRDDRLVSPYSHGWYISEKYDGQRALWDGGVTKGMRKEEVPWANLNRDSVKERKSLCTGLWSRYGNIIHAPEWWTQGLGERMLDGELWMGYNSFQELRGVVSRLDGGYRWKDVRYMLFDSPAAEIFCATGRINNPMWPEGRIGRECFKLFSGLSWDARHRTIYVEDLPQGDWSDYSCWVGQRPLEGCPFEILEASPSYVEGWIVRHRHAFWYPKRVRNVLKVVDEEVGSGVVTGTKVGLGKYSGVIGALEVRSEDGTVFYVSGGLEDEDRVVGDWIGRPVKYKYMRLTNEGKPRNPRLVKGYG